MKNKRKNETNINSWISISDLMAAVLAILVVFFVLQIISTQNERNKYYKVISKLDTTRFEIIDKIKNYKDLNINLNEGTGTIVLDSEVLFESNQYVLKEDGKEFLNKFIPKYIEILVGDNKIRSLLSQIIIEGHTDKQGSYLYNLNLSQKRALSVVEYINSEEIGEFKGKDIMNKFLTANGRSYIDFLGKENEKIDPKSRRVEFRFILKESEALKDLREIFNENGGK